MEYKKLFVGGDLSGIQKFLYNITSRKAAVSLKGRSKFLQKYMENTCKKLKEVAMKAGAKEPDQIYCSGGKFYFITDNTETVIQAIDDCTRQLREDLWKEHFGQLAINVSYVAFNENADGTVNTDGNENVSCGILWKIVNADFAKQKSQKFKDVIGGNYASFFNPISVGGNPKVCCITGVESQDCEKRKLDPKNEEYVYVLPSVNEQIDLGEELSNKQHTKSFEDYAKDSYLGVLRMDVDGLGKRFIDGFASIAEYKIFSKRLDDFFTTELEEKIRQEPEYKDYINIIYAGGDDLFIVGRWDKVIDFAERIHNEVDKRFASDNITISGGVVLVKHKFPIAKSAELAGEAEDSAKSFDNGKKNAFCLFGRVVSWNNEFETVKKNKDKLISLIQNNDLSKGILHKIMLYANIAEQNKVKKAEGKAEDFSYIWHLCYYLTRYMERYNKNDEVREFCKTLRDKELTADKGRNLELMAIAARWAELLIRNND